MLSFSIITLSWIFKLIEKVGLFWGGWKRTKLDLSIFKDNLLAHSHSLILYINRLFKIVSKDWKLLWEQNKINWNHQQKDGNQYQLQLLKSLIYNKNSKGPRTDPWGTPQVIGWYSDTELPIETNCLLFVR